MEKLPTPFPNVWLLQPKIIQDDRGFFLESYSMQKLVHLGIETVFVQDNHSKSVQNTIRGLHFQISPYQIKLVRCVSERIWDVMVNVDPQSPNFGKLWGVELSAENFLQVYIPGGQFYLEQSGCC